jgi:lactoylglutathione lyase
MPVGGIAGCLAKGAVMGVEACIPVIPSADLERSLRLWVDGLEFTMGQEMRKDDKLIGCMLRKGDMWFWLNRRAGTTVKTDDYNGINLYWAPKDLEQTRERLKSLGFGVSELEDRDYGQTEFFLIDDDGFSHCFGVATQR